MKKSLSIFLVVLMILTFACGCKETENEEKNDVISSTDKVESDNNLSVDENTSSSENGVTSEVEYEVVKQQKVETVVERVPIENSSSSEQDNNSSDTEKIDYDKEVRERMQGGINFNGCEGGGMPSDPNHYVYQRSYYDLVAEAGYNNIRFPVALTTMIVTEGPEYLLDTELLRKLDVVINNALNAGLIISIDNHFGFSYLEEDLFIRGWEQLAERYRNYPPELIFELVNEPNGHPDELVNRVQLATVEVIRKTNPTRNIVLAPNQWNGSWKIWDTAIPSHLSDEGKLVYDPNVIIAVHCYQPHDFTHQGYMSSDNHTFHITKENEKEQLGAFTDALEICADYEQRTGRTVWINEWGAVQSHDDDGCLEKYYNYATRELARLDLAYAVWEFWEGYSIFDKSKNQLKDYILENMIVSW